MPKTIIFAPKIPKGDKDMTAKVWESLPVEVRKFLIQKRMEASEKYQGSMTCEKYGVYMR